MLNFIKKNRLILLGIVLGAITGYMYWRQVGCSSGSCIITSKPFNSTLYGALMGGILLSVFQKNNKKTA